VLRPYLKFRDWPNPSVPEGAIGVYTIWDLDARLIYVGMSGRQPRTDRVRWGLYTRLASHAGGRRSGDQFCVYVADRLVLPNLTSEQITEIGQGELSLDALVRVYIHTNLMYRFVTLDARPEAFALEAIMKRGTRDVKPPFPEWRY
jgi:hypothetical protein